MSCNIQNKTIVVWFSCGAASAVAAKKAIETYGKENNVLIVNNPVKEEHEDNIRFKDDISNWLGHPIIEAKNPDFPNCSIVEVFDKRKYMSGINGAPCTMFLKKEARYQFERTNEIDFHVLGFTADEIHRHERFITRERSNTLPILINAKYTKGRCFDILKESGIKLPYIYNIYPNANCEGCVKSSSPTYWNITRKYFSDTFEKRA